MRARKGKIALLGGVVALAAMIALPSMSPGATVLGAKLKGAAEVPGPGDPDGKGGIQLSLKAKKKKVCFTLEYRKLDGGAVAGHIHKGEKGVAGPIKVELFEVDPPLDEQDSFEGCQKNVKRKLIRKIKRRPERFYVNIHTPPYPDGAIRGQLKPDQGI